MGEGGNGNRRGRVKSWNMYKGPMDKDSGEGGGSNVGGRGGVGQGRVVGGNGDNCN